MAIGLHVNKEEAAPSTSARIKLQQSCLYPGFILMLAKIVSFMESNAVVKVLELLAGLFAGQGASAGGDQPPAFVAGDVARCGFQDGKL